jgi:hypothetical protein
MTYVILLILFDILFDIFFMVMVPWAHEIL